MTGPLPRACALLVVACDAYAAGGSPSVVLPSYFRARAVLDAGVEAAGGVAALRAAGTVRRRTVRHWFGSGQGRQPEPFSGPTLTRPATNSHDAIDSFADYTGGRWLDLVEQSVGTSDAVTIVTAVGAASGFESITYQREKPFLREYGSDELRALRTGRQRRHPEGALLMALDRPESLQWVSEGVISFTDAQGARMSLYFDARTRLLTRSETLRSHAIAGDSFADVLYDDYRPVASLKLPFHCVERVAGVPTQEWRASSIELGAAIPEDRFEPPREFAREIDDPTEPTVQKLGEGLYLIRAYYNTMFAVFRDFVVVFEAPVSGAFAENALRLARATAPRKPVRYLVSTHFHFDHVAGTRAYVAEGIPILTTVDAGPVVERVAAARHTLHPDALSRSSAKPRIEAIADRKVIDDGTNRVELYEIGPTQHVSHMLAAYFRRDKVLFVADLWDVISTDLAIAGSDTVALANKLRELGLQVETLVPVHGAPGTGKLLEQALAIRAKYFR